MAGTKEAMIKSLIAARDRSKVQESLRAAGGDNPYPEMSPLKLRRGVGALRRYIYNLLDPQNHGSPIPDTNGQSFHLVCFSATDSLVILRENQNIYVLTLPLIDGDGLVCLAFTLTVGSTIVLVPGRCLPRSRNLSLAYSYSRVTSSRVTARSSTRSTDVAALAGNAAAISFFNLRDIPDVSQQATYSSYSITEKDFAVNILTADGITTVVGPESIGEFQAPREPTTDSGKTGRDLVIQSDVIITTPIGPLTRFFMSVDTSQALIDRVKLPTDLINVDVSIEAKLVIRIPALSGIVVEETEGEELILPPLAHYDGTSLGPRGTFYLRARVGLYTYDVDTGLTERAIATSSDVQALWIAEGLLITGADWLGHFDLDVKFSKAELLAVVQKVVPSVPLSEVNYTITDLSVDLVRTLPENEADAIVSGSLSVTFDKYYRRGRAGPGNLIKFYQMGLGQVLNINSVTVAEGIANETIVPDIKADAAEMRMMHPKAVNAAIQVFNEGGNKVRRVYSLKDYVKLIDNLDMHIDDDLLSTYYSASARGFFGKLFRGAGRLAKMALPIISAIPKYGQIAAPLVGLGGGLASKLGDALKAGGGTYQPLQAGGMYQPVQRNPMEMMGSQYMASSPRHTSAIQVQLEEQIPDSDTEYESGGMISKIFASAVAARASGVDTSLKGLIRPPNQITQEDALKLKNKSEQANMLQTLLGKDIWSKPDTVTRVRFPVTTKEITFAEGVSAQTSLLLGLYCSRLPVKSGPLVDQKDTPYHEISVTLQGDDLRVTGTLYVDTSLAAADTVAQIVAGWILGGMPEGVFYTSPIMGVTVGGSSIGMAALAATAGWADLAYTGVLLEYFGTGPVKIGPVNDIMLKAAASAAAGVPLIGPMDTEMAVLSANIPQGDPQALTTWKDLQAGTFVQRTILYLAESTSEVFALSFAASFQLTSETKTKLDLSTLTPTEAHEIRKATEKSKEVAEQMKLVGDLPAAEKAQLEVDVNIAGTVSKVRLLDPAAWQTFRMEGVLTKTANKEQQKVSTGTSYEQVVEYIKAGNIKKLKGLWVAATGKLRAKTSGATRTSGKKAPPTSRKDRALAGLLAQLQKASPGTGPSPMQEDQEDEGGESPSSPKRKRKAPGGGAAGVGSPP